MLSYKDEKKILYNYRKMNESNIFVNEDFSQDFFLRYLTTEGSSGRR